MCTAAVAFCCVGSAPGLNAHLKMLCHLGAHGPRLDSLDIYLDVLSAQSSVQNVQALGGGEVIDRLYWREVWHL